MNGADPHLFQQQPENRGSAVGHDDGQISAESVLRARARALIEAGDLPNPLPDRMWGGPGIGLPCTVCGAPVESHEAGLELEVPRNGNGGTSSHHFHVRCFTAVELEIRELRQVARPSTPVSGTLEAATDVLGTDRSRDGA